MTDIFITEYQQSDDQAIAELFYQAVMAVDEKYYSLKQKTVWVKNGQEAAYWALKLQGHCALVAKKGDKIVGFGDVYDDGYLDHLYIAPSYWHKGAGSLLCDALEKHSLRPIRVHASKMAYPFFLKRGYELKETRQVIIDDISLTNYLMVKE